MSAANNGATVMQYGLLNRPRSRRFETDTPPPASSPAQRWRWQNSVRAIAWGGVLGWCAIGAAAWVLFGGAR